MKRPIIIGLTGQTGAGKSTVAAMMKTLGAKIIDADQIAREIFISETDCLKRLADIFGSDIIKEDGSCNRKLLAQRAFSTKENTEILNQITHPCILNKTREYISMYAKADAEIVVFDASQLYESGGERLCDFVIAVTAPQKLRLQRILKRDHLSEEDALLRIHAQNPEEYYTKKAEFIINGSQDKPSILQEIKEILRQYATRTGEDFS